MGQDHPRQWRFIDSGAGDASYNMALDEALMRSAAKSGACPTLRVYGWSTPSVSLGYAQDPELELDLRRCSHDGVQVVRRITGGRAVYHDRELTYSVTGQPGRGQLGNSMAETYSLIAGGILRALDLLGVRAGLERSGGQARPHRTGLRNPCFSSKSRYEIAWQGRKLAGSAQRRANGAVLQQGSVLLANTQERLAELMPDPPGETETVDWRAFLARSVVGLDEILGREVGFDQLAPAFREGFQQSFRCPFVQTVPTLEELELARTLETGRYRRLERSRFERIRLPV